MRVFNYLDFKPQLGKDVFLAPGAKVIGNVRLGDFSNIWFNTVLRGDVNEIVVGDSSNIQDLCMLHVVEELPLIVGDHVSVGHSVTLHACTVGDGCLIGMGATLLDGCEIGENSLVAANSLVSPGKKFPPGSMIMGSPAKVVRPLSPEEIDQISNHYQSYVGYSKDFMSQAQFGESSGS